MMVRTSKRDLPGSGTDAPPTGVTPELRLRLAREYAASVFGKQTAAASWLGRVHASILGGRCTASAACLTPEGFRDTMVELRRIHEQGSAPG